MIHEVFGPVTHHRSLGYELDGRKWTVRPFRERLASVVHAWECICSGRPVAGYELERVLGHTIHVFGARPELFSIFRAVYEFIGKIYLQKAVAWPSVMREVRHCIALAPFACARLDRAAATQVVSTDASLTGMGVMSSRWSPEVVRSTLAVKERSRFLSGTEAFRARAHALSKTQVDAFKSVVDYSEKEIRKFYKAMAEFPEIAVNLLDERDWNLESLCQETLFVFRGYFCVRGSSLLSRSETFV